MKRILTQRQLQLGILAAAVILVIIVVGFGLLGITKFKDAVSILQSVITIFAILVGGAFAIFKLQLFRDFEPHLTISQEITHRFTGNEYVHVAVTSTLNNNSRVRVELTKGFFRVQQILPVTNEEVERLYAQVFVNEEYEDIQWPMLDEFQRTWPKNGFVVEPGESHQETSEFIVSSEVGTILVYTYFYNSMYSPGSQSAEGWAATTVYDIVV